MPKCSCGCGQTLSRRQIQRHLQKQVVPRLVTAAVAQFQTMGTTVSAPRLNPSKKRRTSRRCLPSSLEPSSEDEEILSDQPPADELEGDMDIDWEETQDVNQNERMVLRAIGHSQQGIWSGRHHGVAGFEDSDSEEEDGYGDEAQGSSDDDGDDYDHWDINEDLEDHSGLSALDRLGEDFERNAAANGESLSPLSCMM
jgi:hypothetical protein